MDGSLNRLLEHNKTDLRIAQLAQENFHPLPQSKRIQALTIFVPIVAAWSSLMPIRALNQL